MSFLKAYITQFVNLFMFGQCKCTHPEFNITDLEFIKKKGITPYNIFLEVQEKERQLNNFTAWVLLH